MKIRKSLVCIVGMAITVGAAGCSSQPKKAATTTTVTKAKADRGAKEALAPFKRYDHGDFSVEYPPEWTLNASEKSLNDDQTGVVSFYNFKTDKFWAKTMRSELYYVRSGGHIAAQLPKNGVYAEVLALSTTGQPVAQTAESKLNIQTADEYRKAALAYQKNVKGTKERADYEHVMIKFPSERTWVRHWTEFTTAKGCYLMQVVLADDVAAEGAPLAQYLLKSVKVKSDSAPLKSDAQAAEYFGAALKAGDFKAAYAATAAAYQKKQPYAGFADELAAWSKAHGLAAERTGAKLSWSVKKDTASASVVTLLLDGKTRIGAFGVAQQKDGGWKVVAVDIEVRGKK